MSTWLCFVLFSEAFGSEALTDRCDQAVAFAKPFETLIFSANDNDAVLLGKVSATQEPLLDHAIRFHLVE